MSSLLDKQQQPLLQPTEREFSFSFDGEPSAHHHVATAAPPPTTWNNNPSPRSTDIELSQLAEYPKVLKGSHSSSSSISSSHSSNNRRSSNLIILLGFFNGISGLIMMALSVAGFLALITDSAQVPDTPQRSVYALTMAYFLLVIFCGLLGVLCAVLRPVHRRSQYLFTIAYAVALIVILLFGITREIVVGVLFKHLTVLITLLVLLFACLGCAFVQMYQLSQEQQETLEYQVLDVASSAEHEDFIHAEPPTHVVQQPIAIAQFE